MQFYWRLIAGLSVAVVICLLCIPAPEKVQPLERKPALENPTEPNTSASAEFLNRARRPALSPSETISQDNSIANFKAALLSGDQATIEAALQKLSLWLEEHPEDFATLFGPNDGIDFNRLLPVLSRMNADQFGAAGNKVIARIALTAAQDSHSPVQSRQAALALLGKARSISPDLLEIIPQMAREDADHGIRLSAISTMAVWMHDASESREPVTEQLLQTLNASDDTEIRSYIVQLLARNRSSTPETVIPLLKEFVSAQPTTENRLLAALSLGGETPEAMHFSLQQLQQAFNAETNLNTQHNILTQMARLARTDSIEAREKISPDDAALAQDAKDYLEIMQAGITDPNEIQTEKLRRDAKRASFQ